MRTLKHQKTRTTGCKVNGRSAKTKYITDSPGVYIIVNNINNKFYLGCSNNIRKRKNLHWHKLRKNSHRNTYLQRAVNKYGIDNFSFVVIQETTKNLIYGVEHYWANLLDIPDRTKCYNINSFNPFSKVGCSKESIEKRVATFHKNAKKRGYYWTKEQIESGRKNRTGHRHTKEAIEKIRKSSIGRKQSQKSIEKTRQANIISVVQIDPKTNNKLNVFNSIGEANLYLKKNKNSGKIGQVCKGKRKTAYGFKWIYNETT